jgi:D-arginine dehydrogenase
VEDGELVIGFAPDRDGFFWLAGQGGYGIQTSPGASMLAACLIENRELPAALKKAGVDPAATSPDRLGSR